MLPKRLDEQQIGGYNDFYSFGFLLQNVTETLQITAMASKDRKPNAFIEHLWKIRACEINGR